MRWLLLWGATAPVTGQGDPRGSNNAAIRRTEFLPLVRRDLSKLVIADGDLPGL